ncbi:hypothetical protein MRX96_009965 [Rhipicephalus microplus]
MIKEALANATMLTYPQPGFPHCVMMDASDAAIGAVLQQRSRRNIPSVAIGVAQGFKELEDGQPQCL